MSQEIDPETILPTCSPKIVRIVHWGTSLFGFIVFCVCVTSLVVIVSKKPEIHDRKCDLYWEENTCWAIGRSPYNIPYNCSVGVAVTDCIMSHEIDCFFEGKESCPKLGRDSKVEMILIIPSIIGLLLWGICAVCGIVETF